MLDKLTLFDPKTSCTNVAFSIQGKSPDLVQGHTGYTKVFMG